MRKSERRLYLMRRGEVLRSYRVALGLIPEGPKERAGDFRTPEGHYQLTRRNSHSDYFLSIQVSYPNAEDLRRARRDHVDAGGSIMVHGLPNYQRHPPDYYAAADWTDGCIAHVEFRYGGAVADDPRQHTDRNPALSAVPSAPQAAAGAKAGGAQRGSAATTGETSTRRHRRIGRRARRTARQPRDPVAGRDRQAARYQQYRPVHAVSQLRAGGAQFRQRHRQCQGDLRALPRLRRADRAPRLGHQARDHQRAGGGVCRRPDDPRHQGAPVRGAARHHLHRE